MKNPLSPEYWNDRYAEDTFAYGEEPNAFLVTVANPIKPGGRVLVPGDGEGRNGVWLARQGFDVTTVDMSEVGCAKAMALAEKQGVTIKTVCADLMEWHWPIAEYDAVVSIFLHFTPEIRPALHGKMRDALVPEGRLIIEAFDPAHLALREINPSVGGPGNGAMLYDTEMLAADFAPMQLQFAEHCEVELAEGHYHHGRSSVVRAVFSKHD
jgi:SAM-dependent methyltransferase